MAPFSKSTYESTTIFINLIWGVFAHVWLYGQFIASTWINGYLEWSSLTNKNIFKVLKEKIFIEESRKCQTS